MQAGYPSDRVVSGKSPKSENKRMITFSLGLLDQSSHFFPFLYALELSGGDCVDCYNGEFEQRFEKVHIHRSRLSVALTLSLIFRFIRLLQSDAERRKEDLENVQHTDRSTSDWLTRHVSIQA